MAVFGSITADQRKVYLEKLRDGMPKNLAAAEAGLTGTKFRALASRDEQFAAQVADALADGVPARQDEIREHFWYAMRKNPRLLWYGCVTYLPECAWARRGAQMTTEEAAATGLENLSRDELAALRELLTKAQDGQGERRLRAV